MFIIECRISNVMLILILLKIRLQAKKLLNVWSKRWGVFEQKKLAYQLDCHLTKWFMVLQHHKFQKSCLDFRNYSISFFLKSSYGEIDVLKFSLVLTCLTQINQIMRKEIKWSILMCMIFSSNMLILMVFIKRKFRLLSTTLSFLRKRESL